MATVLLITTATGRTPYPPLASADHTVIVRSPEDQVLTDSADADIVLIDARSDIDEARDVAQVFAQAGVGIPRVVILTQPGLTSYSAAWQCDDFILDQAGAPEVEARLRILTAPASTLTRVTVGGVVIDEGAYAVWLDDDPLELTYTEFELLRFLALHPGRVFSREQLLDEVWGHDYFGGARTVDVHVRRLRAKLGPEHESLIGTVRNVGYRFTPR